MDGDNLLLKFEKDRNVLLDLLRNKPDDLGKHLWKGKSLFWFDQNCNCEFGKRESRFRCQACQAFSCLLEISPTLEGFILECGDNEGLKLKIERFPVEILSISETTGPNIRAHRLLSENSELRPCCPSLVLTSEHKYLKLDPYTAKLINGIIYSKLGDLLGFPTSQTFSGFVCRKTGYLVREENIPFSEIRSFSPEHILIQMILILFLVTKAQVTYGKPCLESFSIREKKITYDVKIGKTSRKLEFPLTLILNLSEFSSLSLDLTSKTNLRVVTSTAYSDRVLDRLLFNPNIKIESSACNYKQGENQCSPESILTYMLTEDILELYLAIRNSGTPLFGGSFDLYCLFFSLMAYFPFYNQVKRKPDLRKYWVVLWREEELGLIEGRVTKYHNRTPPAASQVFFELLNVSLRCDAVNLLSEML